MAGGQDQGTRGEEVGVTEVGATEGGATEEAVMEGTGATMTVTEGETLEDDGTIGETQKLSGRKP